MFCDFLRRDFPASFFSFFQLPSEGRAIFFESSGPFHKQINFCVTKCTKKGQKVPRKFSWQFDYVSIKPSSLGKIIYCSFKATFYGFVSKKFSTKFVKNHARLKGIYGINCKDVRYKIRLMHNSELAL